MNYQKRSFVFTLWKISVTQVLICVNIKVNLNDI